jgi:hypothetical protein
MWIIDAVLVLIFLFLLPGAFVALIKWIKFLINWLNGR